MHSTLLSVIIFHRLEKCKTFVPFLLVFFHSSIYIVRSVLGCVSRAVAETLSSASSPVGNTSVQINVCDPARTKVNFTAEEALIAQVPLVAYLMERVYL